MFDEISRLKRRARRAYLTMSAEGRGLDCGHALAQVINPRYSEAARTFDECMARLREIDPSCPRGG